MGATRHGRVGQPTCKQARKSEESNEPIALAVPLPRWRFAHKMCPRGMTPAFWQG